MNFPSSVWDMMVVLSDLRTDTGIFLPMYWSIPAKVFSLFGWAPTTESVLLVLVLISLVLSAIFFWRRQSGYMIAACAIWGLLVADTPYVIVLPALVWFVWTQVIRLLRWMKHRRYTPYFRTNFGRFVYTFFIVAAVTAALNYWRFEMDYVVGYARNMMAAVRWDGGWHPMTDSAMDELLNEYVTLLAKESEGREWIFSDGLCDAGIELASKGKTMAISLVNGTIKGAAWEKRGFSRFEDLTALEGGPAGLLRAWAVDRPENLTNATFQCGFRFMEKEAADHVEYCGLVMRSKGKTSADDTEMAAVRKLGERIVAFYERGNHKPADGGRIRSLRFCSMQWRVARALRRHAMKLDLHKQVKEAMYNTELSERLDKLNPMARRADAVSDSIDMRLLRSFTPREGLALALSRANFGLAKIFAKPLLKDEPDNPEANFAMAMGHMASREYAQARHYFLAALKRSPNDPALLNNLAVAAMEMGDFDEAEARAKAALAVKPDDAAIKNTLRQIEVKRKQKNRPLP